MVGGILRSVLAAPVLPGGAVLDVGTSLERTSVRYS